MFLPGYAFTAQLVSSPGLISSLSHAPVNGLPGGGGIVRRMDATVYFISETLIAAEPIFLIVKLIVVSVQFTFPRDIILSLIGDKQQTVQLGQSVRAFAMLLHFSLGTHVPPKLLQGVGCS
jgi:hypothetical protein